MPAWLVDLLTSSFNQLLFGFSIILFWGDLKQASGLDAGHWFWGTTLYLAVLLTVLGKAALISECVIRSAFRAAPPLRFSASPAYGQSILLLVCFLALFS